MRGYNVNIYFQEKTYNRLRSFTGERKISQFVNQAVVEKLAKEKKTSKEQLIADYKSTARSKAMRAESKIWEGSVEDGIDE